MSNETWLTRRGLLTMLAVLFNGLVGVVLAVPVTSLRIARARQCLSRVGAIGRR
jgi:hypothetical protein